MRLGNVACSPRVPATAFAILSLWFGAASTGSAAPSTVTLTVAGCATSARDAALELDSSLFESERLNQKIEKIAYRTISDAPGIVVVQFLLDSGNRFLSIKKGDCSSIGGLRILDGVDRHVTASISLKTWTGFERFRSLAGRLPFKNMIVRVLSRSETTTALVEGDYYYADYLPNGPLTLELSTTFSRGVEFDVPSPEVRYASRQALERNVSLDEYLRAILGPYDQPGT